MISPLLKTAVPPLIAVTVDDPLVAPVKLMPALVLVRPKLVVWLPPMPKFGTVVSCLLQTHILIMFGIMFV